MILFDGTHLTSDTSWYELMVFARTLGLHTDWLQAPYLGIIHFDLLGSYRQKVLVNCNARYIVKHGIRRHG